MAVQLIVRDAWIPAELQAKINAWSPKSELGKIVRECFAHLPADLASELLDRICSCAVMESTLRLVVIRTPDSPFRIGRSLIEDYGIVSRKVLTTAGVNYLCADFAGGANDINLNKYHGIGTGTTAEATGDTALVTELTTQYNPDNTRATGSQSASTNTYSTTGTNTVDATAAVTEHGVFTQAATGGGTLLDRSVFAAVNLASGDSLQSAYTYTANAGG